MSEIIPLNCILKFISTRWRGSKYPESTIIERRFEVKYPASTSYLNRSDLEEPLMCEMCQQKQDANKREVDPINTRLGLSGKRPSMATFVCRLIGLSKEKTSEDVPCKEKFGKAKIVRIDFNRMT